MTKKILKWGVFLLVPVASQFFLPGCVPKTAVPLSGEKPRPVHDFSASENGDRYYYFIQAHLMQRRGDLNRAIFFLEKSIEKDPGSASLKRDLASLYLRHRKPRKALVIIEEMLRDDPGNTETLILFGKLKQGLKDADGAKEAYERVLSIDPGQKEIYLRLGPLYLEEDDLANAFRIYEQLVRYFPDSYVGHFFLGKIYAEEGKLREAEKAFLRTLEIEPDLEEPRFELLNIYEIQGKEKKIIRLYKELLAEAPDNFRAAIGLGYFYHNIGMLKSSENILRSLGEKSRNTPDILRTVVQVYIEQKKYDAAVIILEEMLKGAPESSDLHYIIGVAFDGIDDDEMVLTHFRQVRPDSRFYQNAAVHIAYLYQERKEIQKGIGFLKEVIREQPDNVEFIIYLASFYEEAEDFSNAIKTLNQGLDIAPENPRIYFRLGVVYDKWKRKADSIAAMKKAIEIDPKNSNALNYLGYTYADLGQNLDEAERLIREALRHKPEDGYIIDSLGWVFFKKGIYPKALEYLIKAAEIVPDDPVILEHVGDAYMKLRDSKNALKFYKKSRENREAEDRAEIEKINKKIREAIEKKF